MDRFALRWSLFNFWRRWGRDPWGFFDFQAAFELEGDGEVAKQMPLKHLVSFEGVGNELRLRNEDDQVRCIVRTF